MKGQLWQECRCGREPVCIDCERCERHCRCGQIPRLDPTPADPYRRGHGQGFGPADDGGDEVEAVA